jgi:lipopolysaccharide/colanic/teichoic acid biosynthesis glycosyltransferase
LNALPGITGAWQLEARSTLLDLDAVNNCDLEYGLSELLFKVEEQV